MTTTPTTSRNDSLTLDFAPVKSVVDSNPSLFTLILPHLTSLHFTSLR